MQILTHDGKGAEVYLHSIQQCGNFPGCGGLMDAEFFWLFSKYKRQIPEQSSLRKKVVTPERTHERWPKKNGHQKQVDEIRGGW